MRFKRGFTDSVPGNKEKAFADKGIATYRGTARFVVEDAIEVGGERLEGRHLVISSGAEPVPLPISGAEHVTTSDRFLELEELPRRVLFIGGGYVSFEFAHLAARANAEVVVLDRGGRPSPDPNLRRPLAPTADTRVAPALGEDATQAPLPDHEHRADTASASAASRTVAAAGLVSSTWPSMIFTKSRPGRPTRRALLAFG